MVYATVVTRRPSVGGMAGLLLVALSGCHHGPPRHRREIQSLVVPQARGAIRDDGVLDEPDWARAADTGDLVDTLSGAVGDRRNARGRVKVLWDDAALHVAFEVQDGTQVDHGGGQVDPHLWEDDCAEVMLDPGGDARDYFEIQVGPRGSVFDTRYTAPRMPRPFGQTQWSSGIHPGVHATATMYTVEMSIAWSALEVPAEHPTEHPGDDLRANFYLMDRVSPAGQRFAGWSPPLVGDFHVPARFGHLHLAP